MKPWKEFRATVAVIAPKAINTYPKGVVSFLHPTTAGRGMHLLCYVKMLVELVMVKKMNRTSIEKMKQT